jgi:cell filamentation protein
MKPRDPYLRDDAPVLKNLLGIKDADTLEKAEADITYFRLGDVDGAVVDFPFGLERLLAIHKHIFGDIYEWAGTIRNISIVKGERVLGGDTVRYSQPDNIKRDCNSVLKKLNAIDWTKLGVHETAERIAKFTAALWQTHPFREGNTRTVMTFATQFAEAHGFRMDKSLLKDSAAYVRDALVKASDGEYSEYDYLVKIFEDAIRRG